MSISRATWMKSLSDLWLKPGHAKGGRSRRTSRFNNARFASGWAAGVEMLESRAMLATDILCSYTGYDSSGHNGSLSITLPNNASNPLATNVNQTFVNNAASNLLQFGFWGATDTYTITWTSTPPTNSGYHATPTTLGTGGYLGTGGSFQFNDEAVKDLTILEKATGTTYADTVLLNTVPLNTATNSSTRVGNLWNNIDITAKKITFGTDSYSSTDLTYPTNTFALASNSIALKSNDSLNFTTTGVTYLGSITVNPAAAAGQPYAGDQSLVGPDWGSLGYAPDNPTNYNSSTTKTTYNYIQTIIGSTTYTNRIEAVIGTTLYIKPATTIPTGSVEFATVQPLLSTTTLSTSDANGFIPRLSALLSLSLTVTDPAQDDQSITTAIRQLGSALSLSAQTNSGNITIQDVSTSTGINGLYVNNASIKGSNDVTGAITIAANAAIQPAYPVHVSDPGRWSLKNYNSQVPTITSDGILKITTNLHDEGNAAWCKTPVYIDRNFTASFGYSSTAGGDPGHGATFTLQNDPKGADALGVYSTGMGYRGMTNSVAYQLNLYSTYTRGTTVKTDGTVGDTANSFNPTTPVDIGLGHYISVNLRYDAAAHTLTETLTDQNDPVNIKTYSKIYSNINIQNSVGNKPTAYMGFTGGTGNLTSDQFIYDFRLIYDDGGQGFDGRLTATDVTLYATGTNGAIGNTYKPLDLLSSSEGHAITVTAQANDGAIFLNQWDAGGNEGLILSKLTAAQGGSTASAQNNQVVYNSTPSSSTPTYAAGNHNISIGTNGPVVVDDISATGMITLYGSSILQGDDKSPNVIATGVSLNATGTANYVGQVTYTRGTNGSSDTLTLPTNAAKTWPQLGFVANQQIAITGASALTNNGFFRVSSISVSGLTLILTASEIVSAETDFVTVGNGVIGLPGSQANGQSNALQLTSVPQISATTVNGSMFLQLGGSVNSTAVAVTAGSANGMPNNVSIASDAQFLITKSINAASGQVALNMSSGTIFQFPGQDNATIRGQSVSLTSPYEIGTRQKPVWTGATGGLILNMTATSRSPASAYVVNTVVPTSLSVSTYDGDVMIKSSLVAPGSQNYHPADVLTFTNNELSVAPAAATVPVNFSNTDGDHGSDGDVKVTLPLTAGSISAGISSSGTAGTGKILTSGSGKIAAAGSTLNLNAGSGIGSAATPVSISSLSALTLVANTNSGLINLKDNSSLSNVLSLNAFTGSGNIAAQWSGDIQLYNTISVTNVRDLILDSISATGSVQLTSTGSILNTNNFGISAGNDSTITLAAARSIGTASNPMLVTTGSSLIASGPNSTANVPVTAASIYVEGSSNLTVSQAVATGTVDISATGDLSLAGAVSGLTTSLTSETGAVIQSAGTISSLNTQGHSFDGSTSITIPSSASPFSTFTTGFSAGMWVYPTSFSTYSGVFGLTSGGTNDIWVEASDSTGGLSFANIVNGVEKVLTVPNALTLNQWQYLAVTISTTGTGRVYVNGNLLGSPTAVGVPSNVTRGSNVIGMSNHNSVGFHGQMSRFGVWDTELTQGQIQAATASFTTPYAGNQSGLLYQNSLDVSSVAIQGQSIGSLKGQSFDGSTSITIPSSASPFSTFTTGFSAGMWVYPTSFSTYSGVFALGSGGTFGTPTANDIWMELSDSTGGLNFVNTVNGVGTWINAPKALTLNQWQYLAVTISTTGTGRVYVNGNLAGSAAAVGVPSNVTRTSNFIGKDNYHGVGFHGQMNLFSVWDRELTQGEIQAATASLYTPYTGNQDGLLYQNSLGSISGVLQTNTPSIHAIANNGGIYLSNSNSTLNLTADSIGTDSGDTANNVKIYSAGTINLTQESNATTQLASSLPMGVFNPGGALTLVAGRTLSRDGQTASSGNYQTITSSATTAVGSAAISVYGELSGITVTNPGRGYLSASPPVVTFSGGGGTGATATAQLDSMGKVITITVDTVGSGYTTAPTVILSSPGDDVYTGTFSINGYTDTTGAPDYLQYPNLVIISGTAEVSADTAVVDVPAALITLADLTSKPANSSSVPVINATVAVVTESDGTTTLSIIGRGDIIINTLGLSGTAGNATIPRGWNLRIQTGGDGDGGSVVFLNQDDTITTTGAGKITISPLSGTTSSGAALGHLTTGGGAIAISAVGSISVGKLDAGSTGTISVTSTQGAILFNENGRNLVAHATNLSEATSGMVLTESNRNTATAALANLQLQATVVLAAATAANAAAVATYVASKAQVAANQALASSLKAAMDPMQGAVTAARGDFASANSIASSLRDRVAKDTAVLSTLLAVADDMKFVSALAELATVWAEVAAHSNSTVVSPTVQIPVDGAAAHTAQAGMHLSVAVLGVAVGVLAMSTAVADGLVSQRLDETLDDLQDFVAAQGDASAAKGQLLALQNTLTALSAAYGVATTAYSKSVQESKNLYAYGQTVALTGKHNEAKAIADVVFASPSEPISSSGTVAITATGSVSITPSPDTVLTVTGAPALTLSLDAGGLSAAYTSTTFQAGSGSSAPKLVNFSGFGSVATLNGTGDFKLSGTSSSDAMALQANSQQAGTATLNGTPFSFTGMKSFQYLGAGGGDNLRVTPLALFASQVPVAWNLTVQLDGGTGTLAHVVYDAQNPYVDVETTGTNKALIVEPGIATVGLNYVSQVTVYAQGTANVLNLPTLALTVPTNAAYDGQPHYATATINGGASLNGITPTFTYYRGTMVHSSRQVAAPINAGKYTVVCSWPGDDTYTPATSSQVMNITGAASQVVITQVPTTGTAGTALTQLKVTIVDATGAAVTSNTSIVTIAVASGPAGLTAGSTLTATAVNGVATFSNLILSTTGTYTFTATDGSLASATTGSIAITPAAASKVLLTSVPTTGTAGSALTAIHATVQDAYGNTVTLNTSTVTIAPSASSFANGSTTSVAAVNGVATFNTLILNTTGTYTFTATTPGLTLATTANIAISPAAASKVAFTQVPTTGTAGTALTAIQATVQDAYGNTATTNASTVTIGKATGPAGFYSASTLTASASGGVATFNNLFLTATGTYTFTATAPGLTLGTSVQTTTISPAAANKLAFTQVPTTGTAGSALTAIKATVQDIWGNTVTSNTSTVAIAIATGPTGAGFATGSTLTVQAAAGVATFSNLILNTTGTYTLRATDGSLHSATTANIVISAAAATAVVIVPAPVSASALVATPVPAQASALFVTPTTPTDTAGSQLELTGAAGSRLAFITAIIVDAYGNTVTTDTSTVTIAVEGGPGGFASGSTLTAKAVRGVATFKNLTLTTSGTYRLTATSGLLASATTGDVVVNAAAASKVVVAQVPATATAGGPLASITATVQDAFGNTVTSNTATRSIVVKSGPGGFTAGSTRTAKAVEGVATFGNLTLTKAGTYTFAVMTGSKTVAITSKIVIAPAAASKLVVTQSPKTATAGAVLPALKVVIEDTYGNVVVSNPFPITITVKTGPLDAGFAPSSTQTATAVKGIATFSNLFLNRSGTYTFTATDGSLTSAITRSMVVKAAAASKLVVIQTPSTGGVNSPLGAIKVAVVDAYGNVTPTAKFVTLSISSGPLGGTFASGSTRSVVPMNGVATFTNLKLSKAGTYTLKATAGLWASATSGEIVVSLSPQ